MFSRDVLRMYNKRSTALKTHTTSPGADVTIELREAHEALAGRPPHLPEIKMQRNSPTFCNVATLQNAT